MYHSSHTRETFANSTQIDPTDEWAEMLASRERAYIRDESNTELFTELFGAAEPTFPRQVRGPFYSQISGILSEVGAELQVLDPNLLPESLHEHNYQDEKTQAHLRDVLRNEKGLDFEKIQGSYADNIDRFAELSASAQQHQTIDVGVLDVPVYEGQTMDIFGARACFNACFRMVVNSISDLDLRQSSVIRALGRNGHGNGIAPDETFLQALLDKRFQEIVHKNISVVSGMGMDLASIDTISKKLKQQRPDRLVYCVISLASETAGRTNGFEKEKTSGMIWHASILTAIDNDEATVHDPSSSVRRIGMPNRKLNRNTLLKRWGQGFGRCHLIVVDEA